jgi:hypothetical protein
MAETTTIETPLDVEKRTAKANREALDDVLRLACDRSTARARRVEAERVAWVNLERLEPAEACKLILRHWRRTFTKARREAEGAGAGHDSFVFNHAKYPSKRMERETGCTMLRRHMPYQVMRGVG